MLSNKVVILNMFKRVLLLFICVLFPVGVMFWSISMVIDFISGDLNLVVISLSDNSFLKWDFTWRDSLVGFLLHYVGSLMILLLPGLASMSITNELGLIMTIGWSVYREQVKRSNAVSLRNRRIEEFKQKRRQIEKEKNSKATHPIIYIAIGLGLGWLFL